MGGWNKKATIKLSNVRAAMHVMLDWLATSLLQNGMVHKVVPHERTVGPNLLTAVGCPPETGKMILPTTRLEHETSFLISPEEVKLICVCPGCISRGSTPEMRTSNWVSCFIWKSGNF